MSLRKILQGFRDFGKELNVVVLDDACESEDLFVKLGGDRYRAEAFECIDKSVGKAVEAVSVLHDAFALDIIEHLADLLRRELVVVKERNETGDRALEVDVVLPEGVVGVDEEGLHESYELRAASHEQFRVPKVAALTK
jgi:hypothetical protein